MIYQEKINYRLLSDMAMFWTFDLTLQNGTSIFDLKKTYKNDEILKNITIFG